MCVHNYLDIAKDMYRRYPERLNNDVLLERIYRRICTQEIFHEEMYHWIRGIMDPLLRRLLDDSSYHVSRRYAANNGDHELVNLLDENHKDRIVEFRRNANDNKAFRSIQRSFQ